MYTRQPARHDAATTSRAASAPQHQTAAAAAKAKAKARCTHTASNLYVYVITTHLLLGSHRQVNLCGWTASTRAADDRLPSTPPPPT